MAARIFLLPVVYRANLKAASTASAPELHKYTRSIFPGAIDDKRLLNAARWGLWNISGQEIKAAACAKSPEPGTGANVPNLQFPARQHNR